MDFENSKTRENLMRAFAGECQARTRYAFAAEQARRQKLEAVARVFEFTADQELAHARTFYDALEPAARKNVTIEGNYPVDLAPDVPGLLRAAERNERQEHDHDYARFAVTAEEEGFQLIGKVFDMVAGIELTHAQRFQSLAELLEQDRLFSSGDAEETWMCLNCGTIVHSTMAPGTCPVCRNGQDFFIRLSMAPYTR